MVTDGFKCIAIDMGAGSIRIMMGRISGKNMTYREVYRVPNRIISQEGHEVWDIEAILEGIRIGIVKSLEMAGSSIRGIGVDSWGVDYVVLDRDGTLLAPTYAYRDSRTEGTEQEWGALMTREETFRRTGINFYPFNTLFQLMAHQKVRPFGASERILFMPCYINYLLSGKAANELTIASTSQLLSVEEPAWEKEILDKLGLKEELLGDLIRPGTSLGPVTMKGFPVHEMNCIAVCGHDTASMVAALPVAEPAFAYVVAGTWCIVGIESDVPLLDRKTLECGFTNERGFANRFRILKNTTGLWLIQGLREDVPGDPEYDEIERLTLTAQEPEQVIDPDAPEFYNPAGMKDAFTGFFRKTGQEIPADMGVFLRCAYNSICFSIRYHLDQLEELSGKEIRVLHMAGGGSRSEFLNQRMADLCRRPVVSGPVEGSVLGNILVQGIALGRLGSLDEGRELVRSSFPGKVYRPAATGQVLETAYARFTDFREG